MVLGAQMMCARATDMIGEFTTAIANGLTVHDMLAGVRAHPTYNEGITDALEAAIGESDVYKRQERVQCGFCSR